MAGTQDLLVEKPRTSLSRWSSPAYGLVALTAFAAIVGVWLLMVRDDGRSPVRATADLFLTFTHLTTLLVGVVAVLIAVSSTWRWLTLSHLTVTAMAVVTSVVNMALLDPALAHDWWGVVDFAEHYLIPVALLTLWLAIGPRFTMSWSTVLAVTAVPMSWLAVVLVRGTATDEYPYDFLDVGENGWGSVSLMIVAILVFMLAVGAALVGVDRIRSHGKVTGTRA
ncbi:MAG TPA: Pr6Pr family membrane protein [Actinomycetes bacterium]|nr:Pr6Pr family membrane protein [Actinomycetes bacterium]